MRDVKRIKPFCDALAEIWEKEVPDWRFGQFIYNVMGEVVSKHGDIFFLEEPTMLAAIKDYFTLDAIDDMLDTSDEDLNND